MAVADSLIADESIVFQSEKLDRDRALEPRVERAVDRGHATDADHVAETIAIVDQAADIGGWRRGARSAPILRTRIGGRRRLAE